MPAPHPTGGQPGGMARGVLAWAGERVEAVTLLPHLLSQDRGLLDAAIRLSRHHPPRLGGGTLLPFHLDLNPGSPTCQLRDPPQLTSQKPSFPSKRGNGIPAS